MLINRFSDKDNCFPDFIIAGAAKAGTTSLSRYLNSHEDIFIPSQELNYLAFARENGDFEVLDTPYITSPEDYLNKFSGVKNSTKGDKSVSYSYLFYVDEVIHNIYTFFPHPEKVKIILILRQPVERMFSQYVFNLERHEHLPFWDAVEAWPQRREKGWVPSYDYLGAGYYAYAVEQFQKHFLNTKVIFFEDLKNHLQKLMKEMAAFLGVKNHFKPVNKAYNASGVPKNPVAQRFFRMMRNNHIKPYIDSWLPHSVKRNISELMKRKLYIKPQLPESDLKRFNPYFSEDIQKVERLTGKDLTHWK
ncbi:MAG: sulfotransferase family protein [Bacteroidota bacterium]